MAKSVQVKLNLAGIRALKREPGVQDFLRERGERVAEAARASATNDYFREHIAVDVDIHPIAGAVCHITAWSNNGMATEAKHGTLARALDAAGGA